MKLAGAPKQVAWAEKVRKDRLKVWQETSPEIFKAIEPIVTRETRADWWIAYKDKGLDVVCKHLLGGGLQRSSAVRQKNAAAKKP
ncbi:MAG TPA: hypothetical protein VI298_02785 [Geobacteraceae bacterium]